MSESRRTEVIARTETMKRALKLDQKTLAELGKLSLLGQMCFLALMHEMRNDSDTIH